MMASQVEQVLIWAFSLLLECRFGEVSKYRFVVEARFDLFTTRIDERGVGTVPRIRKHQSTEKLLPNGLQMRLFQCN